MTEWVKTSLSIINSEGGDCLMREFFFFWRVWNAWCLSHSKSFDLPKGKSPPYKLKDKKVSKNYKVQAQQQPRPSMLPQGITHLTFWMILFYYYYYYSFTDNITFYINHHSAASPNFSIPLLSNSPRPLPPSYHHQHHHHHHPINQPFW